MQSLSESRYAERNLLAFPGRKDTTVALPQDLREEIVRTFHTRGSIPEESELMRNIARPKRFPDNVPGQFRTPLPYGKRSSS